MIKVNVSGCQSFVKEADYKQYVQKALAAFDVLEGEQGAGADFLGWKHLPSEVLDPKTAKETPGYPIPASP